MKIEIRGLRVTVERIPVRPPEPPEDPMIYMYEVNGGWREFKSSGRLSWWKGPKDLLAVVREAAARPTEHIEYRDFMGNLYEFTADGPAKVTRKYQAP